MLSSSPLILPKVTFAEKVFGMGLMVASEGPDQVILAGFGSIHPHGTGSCL